MKRILVVDDDTKIAKALAIRLEAAGYESLTAINGLDAVDLVFTHKPDLIIMDIWMPVGIGFSVAQRLRTLGLGTIPIIFMTASKLRGLRHAATKRKDAANCQSPRCAELPVFGPRLSRAAAATKRRDAANCQSARCAELRVFGPRLSRAAARQRLRCIQIRNPETGGSA